MVNYDYLLERQLLRKNKNQNNVINEYDSNDKDDNDDDIEYKYHDFGRYEFIKDSGTLLYL